MELCQPKWQHEVEQEGWPSLPLWFYKIEWRALGRT